MGYESQEDGYIAKILQGDGAKIEIGGLIGIMVEEEEDIANIDLDSIMAGEKKVEKSPEVKKEEVVVVEAKP